MKILVMGAGIVGVTAAYVLASRGHEVTVVDRGTEAASECSHANGSQLSFSFANSWASPRTLSLLGKWLLAQDDDIPLILPPYPPSSLWRWGLSFFMNCSQAASERNNAALLRLGLYSKRKLEHLRTYTGIDFHNIREGNLHVFTEREEFDLARKKVDLVQKLGCKLETADRDRCLTIEPALAAAGEKIVGGVFAPLDESGDAHLFATGLMEHCRGEYRAEFLTGREISGLRVRENAVEAALTRDGEEIAADAYVVALGAFSPTILKPAGINIPVQPVKGYSITFPAGRISPTVSITDISRRVVHSKLGGRMRVAGIAELAGYGMDLPPERIEQVKRAASRLFPDYDLSGVQSWACLRAMTPSNLPLIGKTPLANLYLNTGHGTLGWTQAAGSAFLLADAMEGKPAEIPMDGLRLRGAA